MGTFSLKCACAMWWRDATLYIRSWRTNLLPYLFEPVFYLLGIGLGLGLYVDEIAGVDYLEFIAPGLAAAAAMNAALFETTYNVYFKQRYVRLYDAVASTPLTPADIAIGEILWAITRGLISSISFVLVGAALGAVPVAGLGPVILPLFGTAATFAAIGVIYSSVIPRLELMSHFYAFFVTPMFLFGGVFFPVETLPLAGEIVAKSTPLYHGTEAVRNAVAGQVLSPSHAIVFLYCAVSIPLAVVAMDRRLTS